jgi:uncharacterized protein
MARVAPSPDRAGGRLALPRAGDHAGAVPTALITGPTSGIGRAFARALATEGFDLVLVSRDRARLDQVAGEMRERHGVGCEILVADLADLDDTRRVEERLAAGSIDMLVNNAGFGLGVPFDGSDIMDEQRGLDVLVRAVLRLTHAALPPMLARGSGDIVNVSSVAGFLPRGTYGANKAWVTSFSTWAGVRYRKRGLRVMAFCPGLVHTEFHQRMAVDLTAPPSWMWLEADDVVREGLADLRRGKVLSIPSRRYRALVRIARLVPRGLLERVVRRDR